jgi:hypothetical protein
MAKKIIVLDRTGDNRYTIAFWLQVEADRQQFYGNAETTSSYKLATPEEIADLREGRVVEEMGDFSFEEGTTMSDIQAKLVAEYNKRQAKLDAQNRWSRYGTFFDGANWTVNGL